MPLPPSALSLLCEAAARALRGTARVMLPDGRPAAAWGAASDAPDPAALRLVVADGERATLWLERPAAAGPWSDDDRALAALFARLAGDAASEPAAADADGPQATALRRSEERYRAVVESLNEVVFHSDAQGRWTFLNRAWTDITGLTVEESLGRTFLEFAHPDDLAHCYGSYQLLQSGAHEAVRHDVRFRHRDGGWRSIAVFVRAVRDAQGALVGTTGTFNDVTEARTAEAALRRSEERFRRMIENGSDLLLISHMDGTLTYASPSAERLLGWAPSEMVSALPRDLVHPDDVAHVLDSMRRCGEEPGTIRRVVFRVRHRDGGWRRIEALARTLAPDSADEGIVCNGRDVTEQRAAEHALQESESRYRSLVDAAQDMITMIDADGVVVFQSPSAERVLGFAPEEMVGRNVMEFLHPDDVPMAIERLGRVMTRPGTVECVQYRTLCRDGSYRHVESTGRTVLPDSAAAGAVGIVRDITDRIEVEAALRQAKADAEQAHEEAERANRAKSEFLSRMSHELRTPLNSILGFAQVLEDLELPPAYRGGVRHILNGGRHLLNLINEVLDIARIEADEQPLSIEPVPVQAVVRHAVDMVRPLAVARGIRVVEGPGAAADGHVQHVQADRQRLTQVLLNLLSNAVKYNRPDGEVRIEAAAVHDASAGDRVRLRVRDQGAGIAPERQGELFVPFARLGAELTGVEGTGLGLALSQRLAQAMGGTLFLEHSDAAGSVFSVELPAADPLADAPALAARGGPAAGEVRTPAALLYVEDNLANLSLVETILLPHPEWRVLPAPRGRLGLALAVEHAPDVVLLDLHLPDMHGRDVLRELRADPRTAHIPVVVISADATPRTVEALAADGADAFLTKPLDVRDFVQTVERLLARRARVG